MKERIQTVILTVLMVAAIMIPSYVVGYFQGYQHGEQINRIITTTDDYIHQASHFTVDGTIITDGHGIPIYDPDPGFHELPDWLIVKEDHILGNLYEGIVNVEIFSKGEIFLIQDNDIFKIKPIGNHPPILDDMPGRISESDGKVYLEQDEFEDKTEIEIVY